MTAIFVYADKVYIYGCVQKYDYKQGADDMIFATKEKVKFTETVLRDAHQSLMATRMKTEDMLPIAEVMDSIGYDSIECWGGATFDVCMRFLNEDPWERLRLLRQKFRKTKLQMLLRGQNILGYRHYPDDVVDSFIRRSAYNGIDIFRIFDAFNDLRNLERSVNAVKHEGAHAQMAISYTVGRKYNLKYWKNLAKDMESMGADSICIKDMAGLLMPSDAGKLIKTLKKTVKVPVQLHSHCTSGVAPMTYLKAVEAGCDGIDTALSPLAMGTSQPATEVMYKTLQAAGVKVKLNEDSMAVATDYFRDYRRRVEKNGMLDVKMMDVDTDTLRYQVPGGMLSNLDSQMKEQHMEERFEEVLKEVPRVREDLGEPPLVTPSSQIVGTQAVFNVMSGKRYKIASVQTKALLRGEYGRTIAPFNKSVQKKVVGSDDVITCRPADLLEPELLKKKIELGDKAPTEEILLSYILFPQSAEAFYEKK